MAQSEKLDLKSIILDLLFEKKMVGISSILTATGLPDTTKNRRAIQRVLSKLLKENKIIVQGKARARVYHLNNYSPTIERRNFIDIPLSKEAVLLQNYLAQPIQARKSANYNQIFLRSYEPNSSFYLPKILQEELLSIGQAEIISHPAGTYVRKILHRLLVDLSWNSSRLEGNTYSLLETKNLIEHGKSAQHKDILETQMILNHKAAIEYIVDSLNEKDITSHEICSIHALLSDNLLGDSSASGRLRQLSVGITGTTYLPVDNPHLLKEYFDLFIKKLNKIHNPFEKSFFSIVHLSYLQAFEDVNKRTARLVANIPLMRNNLKPLSFVDVKSQDYATALLGIYEKNDISLLRDLYVWAYKRSVATYSALSVDEPNMLKLKYRVEIQKIITYIILNKIAGNKIVSEIKNMLIKLQTPTTDYNELFNLIETEILSLHENNIARYKIKPPDFLDWKKGSE